MKSSVKIKQLKFVSFLESMRGLVSRSRFKKQEKTTISLHQKKEVNIDFPVLMEAILPLKLLVTLSYLDDPLKPLSHIKGDYSLLEVNEEQIKIEMVIQSIEEKQQLLNNLSTLAHQNTTIHCEELIHVDY